MSNSNNVCINCRIFSKRYGMICGKCGTEMVGIGRKWRVPRKADIKGWRDVGAMVRDILAEKARTRYGVNAVE